MEKTEDHSQLKKVVAASMIGSVAEWYEFFLFVTASALVFGRLLRCMQ